MKTINLSNLDGSNGFRLDGVGIGDQAGFSVSDAGDVNGDGFGDLIIGAPGRLYGYNADSSYVVFGKAAGFDATLDLSSLDGGNGFRLNGAELYERGWSGYAVSSAGDVNGDGFDDVIIGDPHFGYYSDGAGYVVFGKVSGFEATLELPSLNGSTGFSIQGGSDSRLGSAVSSAGDVNGDGYDDVIVTAPMGNGHAGVGGVVFGKATGLDAVVISELDGSNGFVAIGEYWYDSGDGRLMGFSVSGAGDINGDGFDDLILSSATGPYAIHYNYVILGKASDFSPRLRVSDLDGNTGFRLVGGSGRSVSIAGDINGDGFDDLIIGGGDLGSFNFDPGFSYVVFGKASGFSASMDLPSVDGNTGFRLKLSTARTIVSNAGDVNGDGFDDLIISDGDSKDGRVGTSYVVFGKASGFGATIDLASLDEGSGFRLVGVADGDVSGRSVSGAGDVNGDGFDDLIIGAYRSDNNGDNSGSSYVVFGDDFTNAVNFMGTPGDDMLIEGTIAAEQFVAGTGNDWMTGGGGADVFHGGGGDDTVTVSGSDFQLVDGGAGNDTLVWVTGDLSLVSVRGKIHDIETINLTGVGNNTLTLTLTDLLNLSGTSNTLTVEGDVGDNVAGLGAEWTNGGISNGYRIFTQGTAMLQIDASMSVDFPGTAGDDALTGTKAAERFEAGTNDKMIGRGGADTFYGEAGDDYIRVGDLNFQLVDGGAGRDTLGLGGKGLNLDLSGVNGRISDIETIYLYGTGDNTLTLTALDVVNLSSTSNTLRVNGNEGDRIVGLGNGWSDGGIHGKFHTYTQGEAVLLVGVDVATDFPNIV